MLRRLWLELPCPPHMVNLALKSLGTGAELGGGRRGVAPIDSLRASAEAVPEAGFKPWAFCIAGASKALLCCYVSWFSMTCNGHDSIEPFSDVGALSSEL